VEARAFCHRVDWTARPRVPPLRSAAVRARRLPLPGAHFARAGCRGGRARSAPEDTGSDV